MTRRTLAIASVAIVLALGAAALAAPSIGRAADHLDAPLVAADGRTDLNDVYVFQSPSNPENTVLVLTVNPFAGVLSDTTFDSKADYEFLIDRTGDAVADTTYRITFEKADDDNRQEFKLRTKGTAPGLKAKGVTGATSQIEGGGAITAGVFDDPFFFDLNGFRNGFQFTGDDAFAGANVSAIVLEVPNSQLGNNGQTIGVWARTEVQGNQVDRIGRPGINTVLIPSELKNAFNAGQPADDPAAFGDVVRSTIASLGGDPALADVLLPDVNTYQIGNADGFLNGRRLADDVIDAELGLLTSGALTTDGVDANDVAFRTVFPYLAPAN